jgi:hypothetical protein
VCFTVTSSNIPDEVVGVPAFGALVGLDDGDGPGLVNNLSSSVSISTVSAEAILMACLGVDSC